MKEKKYRVIKSQGKFYVQIEVEVSKITGILWWRKTTTTTHWERCGDNGRQIFRSRYISPLAFSDSPMPAFKHLQEAMDKIKLFLEPVEVFHYHTNECLHAKDAASELKESATCDRTSNIRRGWPDDKDFWK